MGTQHTTGNEGKQIIIDTDGFEKPVELTRVELASPTFGHYKLDLSRVIVVNLDEKEGLIAQNQRFRAGWIAASKENTHLRETLTARNKELAAKDEELRTARNNSFQGTGQRVRNPLDPTTGQIRNSSTDDIACWFLDTSYDGESFFVRHAYFTGADEPYEKLKRAL